MPVGRTPGEAGPAAIRELTADHAAVEQRDAPRVHSLVVDEAAPRERRERRVVEDTEGDGSEIDQVRYATEEEALEGHERLCSDHAYVLDRIVKKLEDDDAGVDNSGSAGLHQADD